jgi:hypothetical protein
MEVLPGCTGPGPSIRVWGLSRFGEGKIAQIYNPLKQGLVGSRGRAAKKNGFQNWIWCISCRVAKSSLFVDTCKNGDIRGVEATARHFFDFLFFSSG